MGGRLLCAMLLLFALSGAPVTAVPEPRVPGASDNVELVAQLPDIQTMGGRFAGGLLYTTGTAGLRIYDVSNPVLPMLKGALPVPTFSNEDVEVSVSRKLVLLSSDLGGEGVGWLLVVDVSSPATPAITGRLVYPTLGTDPKGNDLNGVGHIANCIADCRRYAWITGARDGLMLVVDLKDPAKPVPAGWFAPTPGHSNTALGGDTGFVHDVHTDHLGSVWVTGSGGIARLDPRDGVHPRELMSSRKTDNDRLDQLTMHNSERLDAKTLLVTEEDWIEPQCNGGNEGSFQTWRVPRGGRDRRLTPLDQWTTELGTYTDGGAPAAVACSSHWFDLNRRTKVVADAWYQQGIRFLEVRNPRDIRQVGYYIPPWESGGLGFSQALWVPGHNDLVYGMSLTSGLTVLRIANGGAGGRTVTAPVLPEWLGPANHLGFRPHPVFGYTCLLPSAA